MQQYLLIVEKLGHQNFRCHPGVCHGPRLGSELSVCRRGQPQRHNVDTNAGREKRFVFKGKDSLSFMVTIWVRERLSEKGGSETSPLNTMFDLSPRDYCTCYNLTYTDDTQKHESPKGGSWEVIFNIVKNRQG